LLLSSICVAALAAPKRKLPLPDMAEVLPIAGQVIALGPVGVGVGVVSPLEQPDVSEATIARAGRAKRAKRERRMLPLYHRCPRW
jgi:hypothetical protein